MIPGLNRKFPIIVSNGKIVRKSITPAEIIRIVAEYFDMTLEYMSSRKRTKDRIRAKYFAIYFIATYTNLTLDTIGKMLGLTHHSSVIHGKNYITDQLTLPYNDYHYDFQQMHSKINSL